jgi:hypothetical protein
MSGPGGIPHNGSGPANVKPATDQVSVLIHKVRDLEEKLDLLCTIALYSAGSNIGGGDLRADAAIYKQAVQDLADRVDL